MCSVSPAHPLPKLQLNYTAADRKVEIYVTPTTKLNLPTQEEWNALARGLAEALEKADNTAASQHIDQFKEHVLPSGERVLAFDCDRIAKETRHAEATFRNYGGQIKAALSQVPRPDDGHSDPSVDVAIARINEVVPELQEEIKALQDKRDLTSEPRHLFLFIRREHVVDRTINLRRALHVGYTDLPPRFPYNRLGPAIDGAKRLWILQYCLPRFVEHRHLDRFLTRGGVAQIVLCHPDSEAARQRSLQLEREDDHISNRIRGHLREWLESHPDRINGATEGITIRFTHDPIPYTVYATNEVAWQSFAFDRLASNDGPQLEIKGGSRAYLAIQRYFDSLFDRLSQREADELIEEARRSVMGGNSASPRPTGSYSVYVHVRDATRLDLRECQKLRGAQQLSTDRSTMSPTAEMLIGDRLPAEQAKSLAQKAVARCTSIPNARVELAQILYRRQDDDAQQDFADYAPPTIDLESIEGVEQTLNTPIYRCDIVMRMPKSTREVRQAFLTEGDRLKRLELDVSEAVVYEEGTIFSFGKLPFESREELRAWTLRADDRVREELGAVTNPPAIEVRAEATILRWESGA
ncbi:MAG: hypothetical protein AAF430_01395 [Myxococcota bacterium]